MVLMADYHSKEIEQKVLAHLLEYEEDQHEYLPKLDKSDFYHQNYREIYQLFQQLYNEDGANLDSPTAYTRSDNQTVIRQLIETPTTPSQAQSIYKNLKDLKYRRKWKRLSEKLQEAVVDEEPIQERAADLEREILEVTSEMYDTSTLKDTRELGSEIIEYLEDNHGPDEITGIESGIDGLDRNTGGWTDGEYIVLAGRPSAGKTDLMISSAIEAARQDQGVIIFSVEMNWRGIYLRMASQISGSHRQKVRRGTYDTSELSKIQQAVGELQELPIRIDDHSTQLDEITYKAANLARRDECDIVFIDYFGIISHPQVEGGNQQNRLREASKQFKFLAKDLDVPLVLVSQLNRNVEHREDKRPRLSDLRGTGGLEQDTDTAIFLYRPAMYKDEDQNKAELIIGKQRNGPVATCKAEYEIETGKFRDRVGF